MKYIIPSAFMVFGGWLGMAILTDSLPRDNPEDSRMAAAVEVIDTVVAEIGVNEAGWGAMGVGILFALAVLMVTRSEEA